MHLRKIRIIDRKECGFIHGMNRMMKDPFVLEILKRRRGLSEEDKKGRNGNKRDFEERRAAYNAMEVQKQEGFVRKSNHRGTGGSKATTLEQKAKVGKLLSWER